MPKQVTCVDGAPDAMPGIAVRAGPFVYTAGFVGVGDSGQLRTGTIQDRTTQALSNVAAALATAGMTLEHVVKATVYLKNMKANFDLMNTAWIAAFPGGRVARTCVEVTELVYGTDVEIEVVAYDG